MYKLARVFGALTLLPVLVGAEEIGEVSTVFKWVGPNDKIIVEAFDDPEVQGVTCYLSRAKTGGVKGGLGLAEDRGVQTAHFVGVQEHAGGAFLRQEAQRPSLSGLQRSSD